MCGSSVVRQEYVDALSFMVKREQPFTAFDVTRQARSLTQDRIPHYGQDGVRDYVAGEFGSLIPSSWNRTSIPIQGGRTVLCYHPAGIDPMTHPMADQSQVQAQAQVPSVMPTPASGQSVVPADSESDEDEESDPDSKVVSVTKEGRLNIPICILKKVHADKDGLFDIFVGGNFMSLETNADGRIRIGKKTLAAANIGNMAIVFADTSSDSIDIKAKP